MLFRSPVPFAAKARFQEGATEESVRRERLSASRRELRQWHEERFGPFEAAPEGERAAPRAKVNGEGIAPVS